MVLEILVQTGNARTVCGFFPKIIPPSDARRSYKNKCTASFAFFARCLCGGPPGLHVRAGIFFVSEDAGFDHVVLDIEVSDASPRGGHAEDVPRVLRAVGRVPAEGFAGIHADRMLEVLREAIRW